jgi:general secretion pathway protein D
MAQRLDQPGAGAPTTRMIRLSNGDAEAITDVLRGLMGEEGSVSNPAARAVAGGRARLERSSGYGSGARSMNSTPMTLSASPVEGNEMVSAPLSGGSASGDGARGFSTPDLTVQPAPELNAIVLRGTPAAIKAVEPLIAQLDVRRPQVLIEAAIVEISGDQAEQLAVQLGVGAAAINRADGAATSFTQLGLPLTNLLALVGNPAAGALKRRICEYRARRQFQCSVTGARPVHPCKPVVDTEPDNARQ